LHAARFGRIAPGTSHNYSGLCHLNPLPPNELLIGRCLNPVPGIHLSGLWIAFHRIEEAAVAAVPGEDEAAQGAFFESGRPGVDVVEVVLVRAPAGLAQYVSHGLLLLVIGAGGYNNDVIVAYGFDQVQPVFLSLHTRREGADGAGGPLVAYEGVVQIK